MQLKNSLRSSYQKCSAFLGYRLIRLKFINKKIEFNGAVKIASSAKINPGSGSITFKGFAEIEDFVVLNAYNGYIQVGENAYIGPGALVYGQGYVIIGKNVLIGPGARIVSSNHSIKDKSVPIRSQPDIPKQTNIEDDVWIGANAVILAGVNIGTGAVIGASSVVTKSIPPYAIAVGNPAQIINYRG